MPKKIPRNFYINLIQAADLLKVDRGTVRRLMAKGIIKGKHTPGSYRGNWKVSFNSCLEFIEK